MICLLCLLGCFAYLAWCAAAAGADGGCVEWERVVDVRVAVDGGCGKRVAGDPAQ